MNTHDYNKFLAAQDRTNDLTVCPEQRKEFCTRNRIM